MSHAKTHEDFEQQFERSFGLLAYVCNRFIVNHMRRVMSELQTDLESSFILGTLAQLNVAAQWGGRFDRASILDDSGVVPDLQLMPIKLGNLSQITGLPRESVRRKLEKLRLLGKVERAEDGGWHLNKATYDNDFRAFTRETVRRLLSTATELDGILKN